MARSWLVMASIVIPVGSAMAVDRLVPGQYPTIQAAINAAASGDSVVVSPGTYTGSGNRDINPLGKAITIRSASGAAGTIIDCQGSQATPRRGFQVSSGTSALVIDGFTIRNGYSSDGGAIWVFGNASPVIKNMVIETSGATRGGGAYFFGAGSPAFQNCTFQQNTATFGGGVCEIGPGTATFTDCVFDANAATDHGAGGWIGSGPASFVHCTFSNGNATNGGGGAHVDGAGNAAFTGCNFQSNTSAWGAGLRLWNGSVGMTDCTFVTNAASDRGGGILADQPNSIVTLTRVVFQQNSAGNYGGGLGAEGINGTGMVAATDCMFDRNTAAQYSGGAWIAWSKSSVAGTTFTGNSAPVVGGLALDGDSSSTSAVSFCTFENNSATADWGTGGGLEVNGNGITVTVADSTFRGNSANGDFFNGGAGICVWFDNEIVTISRCLFENNSMPRGLGAGIFLGPNGSNTIEDCTFQNNTAIDGSAIYDFGGPMILRRSIAQGNTCVGGTGTVVVHREWEHYPSATISDCTISGNQASADAGLHVAPAGATAFVSNTTFENNIAADSGSGGATVRYGATATFTNCTFRGNQGPYAGGAWISDGSTATIQSCVFDLNTSSGGTGGLGIQHGASGLVEDCTITGNQGQSTGGMLLHARSTEVRRTRIESNQSNQSAGGLRIEWTDANDPQTSTIEDCDLVANSAQLGSAIDAFGPGVTANFARCVVASNTSSVGAGAVVAQFSPKLTFENCAVTDNVAAWSGGALLVAQGADVTFRNGEIARNTSGAEGAIFLDTGFNADPTTLLVEDTPITDNVSQTFGVMNLRFTHGAAEFRRCQVERNLAMNGSAGINVEWGGALTLDSCTFADNTTVNGQCGAVNVHTGSSANITSTDFLRNAAVTVGAVRVANVGTTLIMDRCRILGNSAQSWVGAIHAEDGGVGTITNCLIASNTATREAAVAAWYNNAQLDLINCDIVRNTGMAAVWSDAAAIVNVRNSIVRDNTVNIGVGAATLNVSHSNIQGGWAGAGNITGNPLFVDPNGADNVFGTIDDDYTLGDGSPCIDAGDNAMIPGGILLDLAGQSRRIDVAAVPDTGWGVSPIVDMGAYEHLAGACMADFNQDGFVNGDDYDAFAEQFENGDLGADINHDGFVNGDDYDAFAEAFEAGC